MQDYMKALQKQFDRQEFDNLNALVEYTHEELKKSMDIVERKKLLRLLDAAEYAAGRSEIVELHRGLQAGAWHHWRIGSFLLLRCRRINCK